ncbi:MAG: hypothetical protein GY835_22710 [bacterium]|nr:hypothetical protein [bacterium]
MPNRTENELVDLRANGTPKPRESFQTHNLAKKGGGGGDRWITIGGEGGEPGGGRHVQIGSDGTIKKGFGKGKKIGDLGKGKTTGEKYHGGREGAKKRTNKEWARKRSKEIQANRRPSGASGYSRSQGRGGSMQGGLSSEERIIAESQGEDAFDEGAELSDNPFIGSAREQEWVRGYKQAQEESGGSFSPRESFTSQPGGAEEGWMQQGPGDFEDPSSGLRVFQSEGGNWDVTLDDDEHLGSFPSREAAQAAGQQAINGGGGFGSSFGDEPQPSAFGESVIPEGYKWGDKVPGETYQSRAQFPDDPRLQQPGLPQADPGRRFEQPRESFSSRGGGSHGSGYNQRGGFGMKDLAPRTYTAVSNQVSDPAVADRIAKSVGEMGLGAMDNLERHLEQGFTLETALRDMEIDPSAVLNPSSGGGMGPRQEFEPRRPPGMFQRAVGAIKKSWNEWEGRPFQKGSWDD